MIAIKDMEMPKSCSECNFKANDYVCGLLDCAFSCNHFKERNHNCPLVEIVTCKDCKHWRDDGIMTTCDKNIGHGFPRDHFCEDAERKE